MKLIIEDDEGRKTVVPFVREEITIGRQEGNTIRLTERNVSRRHARLMRQNGHVVVEDLGSSNGTRINGERISGQSAVKDGDLIQIGDYDLALQSDAQNAVSTQRLRPSANGEEEPADTDAEAATAEPETETETPVEEQGEEGAPPPPTGDQRRHSTAIIKMDQVEGNRSRKVEELEAEEAPRLLVTNTELKGQEYACIRTEMKIGRTDDNDIVIDHRSLSRTHAKIVREDNGEWRILDMQSANGLTVNGENYAQAALNHGDVIELGHVKLRFVGAGEQASALAGEGRTKLLLVVGLVVLVLVGGAAAFFLLKPGPGTPGPVEDPPQNTPTGTGGTQTAPPEQPPPANPDPPPEQPDPAAVAAEKVAAALKQAGEEFNAGKLGEAEKSLKAAQNPDGTWPPAAQPLAAQLQKEREASDALDAAKAAFDQKNYSEASRLLAPAKGSKLFGPQHDSLQAEIDAALKPPSQPDPVKPPAQPDPGKTPAQPAPNAVEEAKVAKENANKLIKGKQYAEARTMAAKCIALVPNNAECHLLMGVAYAHEQQWEKAKPHYKQFLLLAPDHKLAPAVRKNLQEIDQ